MDKVKLIIWSVFLVVVTACITLQFAGNNPSNQFGEGMMERPEGMEGMERPEGMMPPQ